METTTELRFDAQLGEKPSSFKQVLATLIAPKMQLGVAILRSFVLIVRNYVNQYEGENRKYILKNHPFRRLTPLNQSAPCRLSA